MSKCACGNYATGSGDQPELCNRCKKMGGAAVEAMAADKARSESIPSFDYTLESVYLGEALERFLLPRLASDVVEYLVQDATQLHFNVVVWPVARESRGVTAVTVREARFKATEEGEWTGTHQDYEWKISLEPGAHTLIPIVVPACVPPIELPNPLSLRLMLSDDSDSRFTGFKLVKTFPARSKFRTRAHLDVLDAKNLPQIPREVGNAAVDGNEETVLGWLEEVPARVNAMGIVSREGYVEIEGALLFFAAMGGNESLIRRLVALGAVRPADATKIVGGGRGGFHAFTLDEATKPHPHVIKLLPSAL